MIKALKLLIISLAAPMGNMKRMLYSDWLPERERWALRWLVLFFPLLLDHGLVSVHKNTRKNKEFSQYLAILTSHLVNYAYILHVRYIPS